MRKLNLPKKDKEGNCYLSYSALSCFEKNSSEFYRRYILKEPFRSNPYVEFGSRVGEALENNNFSSFDTSEVEVLNKITRLDEFEREIKLNFDGFYIKGFIDSNSKDFKRIIDYKTGGVRKEFQYIKPDYYQLQIYAMAIQQETGTLPEEATVEFIRRKGNAFKGEKLYVAPEDPIIIDIDISKPSLDYVKNRIEHTAKLIEKFYEESTKW